MRRWQAIPVAALAALAVGAIMFTRAPGASAGIPPPTPIEFYLDCGSGLGVTCLLPSGTTTLNVNAVAKNTTASPIGLSAFEVSVQNDNQTIFAPTTPICDPAGLDCNPDFNNAITGNMNCGSPAPNPDQNPNVNIAESSLFCNTGAPTQVVAAGGTLLLATVHYTVTGNGFGAFQFFDSVGGSGALFTDDAFLEAGTCGPVHDIPANCFGVNVAVGVPNATNTPVPTATNSPLPTATKTPCAGGSCPTATSEAFKTVTPTPGGATATPVGGTTPPPAGTTPAAPGEQPGAAPGGQPAGNTGAGGRGPIRLPDTGSSGAGSADGSIMLGLLATAGTGLLAGSLYFGVAVAAGKRRREGDD